MNSFANRFEPVISVGKIGATYLHRLQLLFLEKPLFRLGLLFATTLILVIVVPVALFVTERVESANIKTIIEKIRINPKTVLLKQGVVTPGVSYVDAKKFIVNRNVGRVTLIMAQANIKCGQIVMAAVDDNNKILNWQWDYRYVIADMPGVNWLVTSVPAGMVQSGIYTVKLYYDSACVEVENIYLLPVQDAGDWDGLLYNDDFYTYKGLYKTAKINGYNIMPTEMVVE